MDWVTSAIVCPGNLLRLFKNLLVKMRLVVMMMMFTVITTSTTMTSTWVMMTVMTITHMRRRGYTPTHPCPIRINLEYQNTVKVKELSPAYQGEGINRILSYETSTTIMATTIMIMILITRSCSPG